MSLEQLQEVAASSKDAEEHAYIVQLRERKFLEQREKDLKRMNEIGGPNSVLYDPQFEAKSEKQSTELPEGSKGESDTGYGDIDYEFINGNPEISELIVGKEKTTT